MKKLIAVVAVLAIGLTCLPSEASAAPGARGFGVRAGVAGGFRGGPRGGILRNLARNLFGRRNVIREQVFVNQFVQPQAFAYQAQAYQAQAFQVVVPQVSQVVIPTVATVQQGFAYSAGGCAAVGANLDTGCQGGFNAAVYGGGRFRGRAGFGTRATCR